MFINRNYFFWKIDEDDLLMDLDNLPRNWVFGTCTNREKGQSYFKGVSGKL